MTKCYFCGGGLEPGTVTANEWRTGNLTLIENVPALVCEKCGESYLASETCEQIDRLMALPPAPRRTMEVPVYAFTERE